jgi:transcription antitermination protein NusB
MLNRRILRIKAMQTLYSYVQCQKSNFNLAIDRIAGDFLPDLNSMEPQDPIKLGAEREETINLFKQSYKTGSVTTETPVAPKIMLSAVAALNFYQAQVQKDHLFLGKAMVHEAERIFEFYLKSLQLLVEFGDLARNEMQEKGRKSGTELVYEGKLYHNLLIDRLRRHELLKEEMVRRNVRLDHELVRQWYKLLTKDQPYLDYRALAETTPEKEAEMANHILRNFIFTHDTLNEYFEGEDLNWAEDRVIVRSMAAKTLKALAETEGAALHELSANWEDDRAFFQQLFEYTIEEDDFCEGLIAERTQNWDIGRITAVDRIIMGMALSEMMHFPSIPVKVTINEYIELSKEYSTPRSYNFVNGLLNAIADDLGKAGKIRKSGRGLIDNK